MKIDPRKIKEIREKTGAGVMEIKKALSESAGDEKEAIDILRKSGQKIAAKKQNRGTNQGLIGTYVHSNGKVAALVEVTCETDFVAMNSEFKELAHDLAMQVAAANPLYLKPEDVPEDVLEKEKEIARESLKKEGKPKEIIEKIIQGKLDKFYSEVCLLKQLFIKDDKNTVEQLVTEKIAKLGENIQVKRFVYFSI
jgi:elongation factor Ts